MFTKEDGPTALRADLVRGLSLSTGPVQVRSDKGAEFAVGGVASVWNGSRGFVAIVIRFLEPPRVERYMYSKPLPDEAAVIGAEAAALDFARELGLELDALTFADLDEASRARRLQNWDRIRKVRAPARADAASGSVATAPGAAPVLSAELSTEALEEPLELEPEDAVPLDESVQLVPLEDTPGDGSLEDTPLEDSPLAAEPARERRPDDTPVSLAQPRARPEDDTPMEIATLGDPESDDTPIELTAMRESTLLDVSELAGESEDEDEHEDEPSDGFIPIGQSSGDLGGAISVELDAADLGDEGSEGDPPTIHLTEALSSDLLDTAPAPGPGGAVIGKIPLVRKEGADRRRLSALGRLLSFF